MYLLNFQLNDYERAYIKPFKKKAEKFEELLNEVHNVYHYGFMTDPYIPVEIDFQIKQSLTSIDQENIMMIFEDFWLRYLNREVFPIISLINIKIPHILQEIEGGLKYELSYIGYNLFRLSGNNENYYNYITKPVKGGRRIFKNFTDILNDSKKGLPNELPYLNNIFKSFTDEDIIFDNNSIKFCQFRNCIAHNKYQTKKLGDNIYLILNNNGNLISFDVIRYLPNILRFIQLIKALRACNHLALNRYYPLTSINFLDYSK